MSLSKRYEIQTIWHIDSLIRDVFSIDKIHSIRELCKRSAKKRGDCSVCICSKTYTLGIGGYGKHFDAKLVFKTLTQSQLSTFSSPLTVVMRFVQPQGITEHEYTENDFVDANELINIILEIILVSQSVYFSIRMNYVFLDVIAV